MEKRSILSVGLIIHEVLTSDTGVRALTSRVYPLNIDEVELPCIVYCRESLDENAVKAGHGSTTAQVSISCVASSYGEAVALAEAVYEALDGKQWELSTGGLSMRRCLCVDASEYFNSDVFVQELVFRVAV